MNLYPFLINSIVVSLHPGCAQVRFHCTSQSANQLASFSALSCSFFDSDAFSKYMYWCWVNCCFQLPHTMNFNSKEILNPLRQSQMEKLVPRCNEEPLKEDFSVRPSMFSLYLRLFLCYAFSFSATRPDYEGLRRYWVFLKKVLYRREEKMQEKIKMT